MKAYKLKENEAVLFKGSAILSSDYKRSDSNSKNCDIMLTNLNVIFFYQKKGLFRTVTKASVFNVADVKIYNEDVQIIRENDKDVVVYLKKRELYLTFEDEKVAKDFCNKAITLISGDSQITRFFKKAKKTIVKTSGDIGDSVAEISQSAAAVVGTVTSGVEAVKKVTEAVSGDKK